jgi:hypothetical protein
MNDQKQRHGCLGAWLVLMIIGSTFSALAALVGTDNFREAYPNAPAWAVTIIFIMSLFNLVCAIALFRWKKWGFWGLCFSAFVAFMIDLSLGFGLMSILSGIFGVAILYGVLHIGRENKGWPQLE